MTIAAALAAIGFAGPAQANTTLPGLNGKILFTSTRDFPLTPDLAGQRGTDQPTCAAGDECSQELYSMNPDGSGTTRLTNNTVFDDTGAWLPADGSQIAFEEDNATDDCCGEEADIWSMHGDGGSPIQLTSDPGAETHPTYSPDGSRIAFSGAVDESTPASAATRLISPSNGSQIYVMSAAGESAGAPTPLLPADQIGGPDSVTVDTNPTWSPDGTKIAFTRLTLSFSGPVKGGDRLIGGFEFDTRTFIAPADGSGPATALETYSPCDFGIAFLAAQNDAQALVRAAQSPDPGALQKALGDRLILSAGCLEDFSPAWSPDGTNIAVSRSSTDNTTDAAARLVSPGDDGDIVVIPVTNPAGEVNLSDLNEPSDCSDNQPGAPLCSSEESPAWSPDGTKIAFQSDRQSVSDGTASSDCVDETTGEPNGNCDFEIWTMNADGTGLTQLTNNAFEDTDPDWQRIPPPVPQTPAPPAAPAATQPKIGVAGVRRACVSSAFHVRFRVTTSSSVKSVVVKLDGKRIKSTSRGGFTLTINSKKLKAGHHRLTITATDSNGKVSSTRKTFSVCKAAKPRRKAAPRFTG
jgi:Tol biopolymer transport system component